jgi:hypothetical protein
MLSQWQLDYKALLTHASHYLVSSTSGNTHDLLATFNAHLVIASWVAFCADAEPEWQPQRVAGAVVGQRKLAIGGHQADGALRVKRL